MGKKLRVDRRSVSPNDVGRVLYYLLQTGMLNGLCDIFKTCCFVNLLQVLVDIMHNGCHSLCYIIHLREKPVDRMWGAHGGAIKFTCQEFTLLTNSL